MFMLLFWYSLICHPSLEKKKKKHRWDFSGYGQISGFKFLSESNENGAEVHFECELAPFRNPVPPMKQKHECPFRIFYLCEMFTSELDPESEDNGYFLFYALFWHEELGLIPLGKASWSRVALPSHS